MIQICPTTTPELPELLGVPSLDGIRPGGGPMLIGVRENGQTSFVERDTFEPYSPGGSTREPSEAGLSDNEWEELINRGALVLVFRPELVPPQQVNGSASNIQSDHTQLSAPSQLTMSPDPTVIGQVQI